MKAPAVLICRILCILCVIGGLLANRGYAQSTAVQHSYPGLAITGTVGGSYPIQYVNVLSNVNNWITLTTLTLTSSPYLFIDTTAPDLTQRFYRDTNVNIALRNYPGLTISGTAGSTNMIQYVSAPGSTNWTTLTNIVLPASGYTFYDTISPAN